MSFHNRVSFRPLLLGSQGLFGNEELCKQAMSARQDECGTTTSKYKALIVHIASMITTQLRFHCFYATRRSYYDLRSARRKARTTTRLTRSNLLDARPDIRNKFRQASQLSVYFADIGINGPFPAHR
jgi:hypothetical protein